MYKARIKDEVRPEEIDIMLRKFKSLILYPLPGIVISALFFNSTISDSLFTEARDKKKNIEKANNQKEICKFVATPPPNILIV